MPLENDEGEDLQLTGSTYTGQTMVVGGVYSTGSLAAYVQALKVDPSGSVFITASGSLPVHIDAQVQALVVGQVGVNNFPATQNVSGTVTSIIGNWPATMGISASSVLPVDVNNWPATIGVTGSTALRVWDGGVQGVSASVPLQIYSSGTVGVSGTVGINNFPATQNVSGTVTSIVGNWPATMGISASAQLPIFSSGPVGITASAVLPVDINNWPAIHGVSSSSPSGFWMTGNVPISGSQLTGSTFAGFPVVVGGAYNAGTGPAPTQYVTALKTDASGAIYITMTGSLPVAISNITISSGSLAVCGTTASGSTQVDPPVSVAGVDNTGLIRTLLTDNQGRIITAPAGSNTTYGEAFGHVALSSIISNQLVIATTYTEQTGSVVVRAVVSTSANDVNTTGTGAWQVTITYYDQSYNGPFTETVNLNGTTRVATVSTTMCFIEKMVVAKVGTGGVTAGTISLLIGNYATAPTLWSIAAGDNQTFAAHHYVASNKTNYITAMGFSVNGGAGDFFLRSKLSGSNQPEIQITEVAREAAQAATTQRSYANVPIVTVGPARINMYVTTEANTSLTYRGSFDFYDQ